MHGRACEERKRGRHMLTAPSRATGSVKAVCSSSSSLLLSPSSNSFFKDGRKISVGDCALFKPPQDCPPFIGIIRSLTFVKENQLNLRVNWLYRPAEVKLGKGILLDAAPNEIFYSFHKDEIPVASLLHPCRVSFLPKGIELPSGVCSFVCRRVYDISNKCLWWLTDQDYIDERQEEVDQLLYKTRLEMHATVQPGGRSPKPMNVPTSTSQLKTNSDSVQNSGASFPSQGKGKKRERADQGSEPVKRERASKSEDSDSVPNKLLGNLRSEIAKITEKGALMDFDGVEKLVQLMLPDRAERKIDLASRSSLAGVVAATDKFDCLSRFVQLRGLPVFDDWLQEVHKGKMGDGTSTKDGDKSVEEFLIILLRALDKLPVNLHALQMCNIGKSVNHLRSHKNVEIQRKARSLVDTWKKRVEAEMDAKSGSGQGVSWPARSRLPDSSHGGTKTSMSHPHASKSSSVKLVQGENNVKSASPSPGSTRLAPSPTSGSMNIKEGQQKCFGGVAVSEVPPTSARDEKSNSCSPSHNNSHSYSSDLTKTGVISGKDDSRFPTVGSSNVNKSSGGSSRHRRSVNGFQGTTPPVVQRESTSSRSSSSLRNNTASEKLSQSILTCEKVHDVPSAEGNAHKLIVKISSRGRSPAQTTSAGSLEDVAAISNQTSSPVQSEKNDQVYLNLKGKSDTNRTNICADVNNDSQQSNDTKGVIVGCNEGGGFPSTVSDEEHSRTVDEATKVAEDSKATSPQPVNELKPRKIHDSPFSINALIESFVKYSDANAPISTGDDVGMNLLASVATGEISKVDVVSPMGSPQANENSSRCNDSRLNLSLDDVPHYHPSDAAKSETEKQDFVGRNVCTKEEEDKAIFSPTAESDGNLDSSTKDLKQTVNQFIESNGKLKDTAKASDAVSSANEIQKTLDDNMSKEPKVTKADAPLGVDDVPDEKQVGCSPFAESNVGDPGVKVVSKVSLSNPCLEGDFGNNDEQKPSVITTSEPGGAVESTLSLGSGKCFVSGNVDELKVAKVDETDRGSQDKNKEDQKIQGESSAGGNQGGPGFVSSVTNCKVDHVGESFDGNEDNEEQSCVPSPPRVSSSLAAKERGCHIKARESGLSITGIDEAQESTSPAAVASPASTALGSDTDAKVEFDLNEGLSGDDGRNGDISNSPGAGTSTHVQLINSLPLPASITVAAPAKGPFVPPEDLLRSKGVHGWKGSAATSAFRPAEPRKVLEAPVGTSNSAHSDTASGKQSRLPLDIDLNVPDERILEDLASRSFCTSSVCYPTSNHFSLRDERMDSTPIRSAGGLDLDLNRVDEPTDLGNYANNIHRLDASFQPVKHLSSGRMTDEAGARMDLDLNNGPAVDDLSPEPSIIFGQHSRSNLPSQPPLPGIRVNGTDVGNFSSWFPTGNSYSGVAIPSTILPDRGDQAFPMVASSSTQRMLGPTTGLQPFNPDLYRGPVLSSSLAVPFQSSAPFQYPVFPFGASFPRPSATFSGGSATYVDSSSGGRLGFPTVNSQLLGPAVAVPSNYPRPYVVSLPYGTNSGGVSEANRNCFRQDLDLNTGPRLPETEGRREAASLAPRPISSSSSQTLAEEQTRIFQMSSGVLKRKEPEGGWDVYKQSSWH